MHTQHTARTTAGFPSVAGHAITRDEKGLLQTLATIDVEGWESEAARQLLTYVRHHLVRPLVIDIGLRGAAGSQAEATAWEAVWLKLCDPHLRSAHSPWGVVWQTARRAVLGEILAARWGTDWRRAWEHDAQERAGRRARPISLELLLGVGLEPTSPEQLHERLQPTPVGTALEVAAAALANSGWSAAKAVEIVTEVAGMEDPLGHRATVVGWRPLAARLGLPPWQAQRLTFVLRGSTDQPGLLARLLTEGPSAARAPETRQALAGTLVRSLPTPTRRQRDAHHEHRPQVVASGPCPHP